MYFPLSVKYRLDKETLAFNGGFTRDNTLMGELLQTGVVLGFTQRNLWNLAPSWTHAFTERLSLQSTYNYSSAVYENGSRLGLLDYEVHGGSLALSHRLSEKDHLQVVGNYTNFSVPAANALQSHIAGGQLSVTHSFAETITATLAGGPQFVSSGIHFGPARITDTQMVWTANANLRKQWDEGYAQLAVSREILPSGFGLLLQTERVGVTVSQNLTERLTLSLSGQVYLASSVASKVAPNALPENRYINVTPNLTWKIDQWWAIDLSYTYGRRDVESLNQFAISNAATVMLTYYPPKYTAGR
jgi:long-subunit fatty acid transport protein